MEKLCSKCHKKLCDINYLDDKENMVIDPESKITLITEGDKKYFKCPNCGAKTLFIGSAPKNYD